MATQILNPDQYKRGFVLGGNGHTLDPADFIDQKIPQLHALLSVLIGAGTEYNNDIQRELLLLAESVASDIHEAQSENYAEIIAKSRQPKAH